MATNSVLPNMQVATAPMSLPGGSTPPPTAPTQMASAMAPMGLPGSLPAAPGPSKPASYSLSAVPQFLQDSLDMSKVKVAPLGDPTSLGLKADVMGYELNTDPYTIHGPSDMGQPVLNHELTHSLQDLSGAQFAPEAEKDPYNYGGVQGLLDAQKAGKKITDFSKEQTARMVEDHTARFNSLAQWAKLGVLQPGDVDAYNKWKSAVGPYMSQLAALKSKKTYKAPAEVPGMVTDLPEFSNRQIAVPQSVF